VPVILSDVFGDPNVGIFSYANEKVAILPAGVSRKKIASFEETLGVEACAVGIAGSRLVGVYASGNSSSVLVPYIITDEELSKLRSRGIPVTFLNEKRTALGNLMLCNDYGAVLDPRLKQSTISEVKAALDIPIRSGTIGGLPHIGALATASNKGVLANPMISESEKKNLSEALNVPVTVGTVNSGIPYPKAGVVVNSKGAVVGSHTLGSELLTLSRIFQTD
jgi:translation initiation factor 6